jgi:diaminopropionate ammonia-lyase
VLASLKAGHPVALASCEPTRMVGLRCAEISPVAWPALEAVADAATTVTDAASDEAAGRLQHPDAGEAIMAVGPSGACGLAAILAILRDRQLRPLRDSLEIGPDTCLFAIATEGAAGAAPHS